jgi:hypothetical protein
MTNKTKCDSCGEETAKDQWSSYTSDDNAKFCIDCGDDLQNDYIAECNVDWQEYKQTCQEENPEAYDEQTGEKL